MTCFVLLLPNNNALILPEPRNIIHELLFSTLNNHEVTECMDHRWNQEVRDDPNRSLHSWREHTVFLAGSPGSMTPARKMSASTYQERVRIQTRLGSRVARRHHRKIAQDFPGIGFDSESGQHGHRHGLSTSVRPRLVCPMCWRRCSCPASSRALPPLRMPDAVASPTVRTPRVPGLAFQNLERVSRNQAFSNTRNLFPETRGRFRETGCGDPSWASRVCPLGGTPSTKSRAVSLSLPSEIERNRANILP
jgi:hypothetical protein